MKYRLEELLLQNKKTYTDISRDLGINITFNNAITLQDAFYISKYLNCSIDDLVENDNQPHSDIRDVMIDKMEITEKIQNAYRKENNFSKTQIRLLTYAAKYLDNEQFNLLYNSRISSNKMRYIMKLMENQISTNFIKVLLNNNLSEEDFKKLSNNC